MQKYTQNTHNAQVKSSSTKLAICHFAVCFQMMNVGLNVAFALSWGQNTFETILNVLVLFMCSLG